MPSPAPRAASTPVVSAAQQEQLDAIASIVYSQPSPAPVATSPIADEVPSSQPELDAAIAALPPSFGQVPPPRTPDHTVRAAVLTLPSSSLPTSQPVVPWAFVSPLVAPLRSPALSASIGATPITDWAATPVPGAPSAPGPETPPHASPQAPSPPVPLELREFSTEGDMLFETALAAAVEGSERVSRIVAVTDAVAADLARPASPPSPPPSPGLDMDWAHQIDPSPTPQEVALARHVIDSGTALTIRDFSAGVPLAAAAAVPLPLDHEEVLPSAPTSELSYKLSALARSIPGLQEDMYSHALIGREEDLPAATHWLTNFLRGRADVPSLMNAYPDAPEDAVKQAFAKHKSGFRAAFWELSKSYKSAWSSVAVGPNPVPGAMDGIDMDSAEFYGDGTDFSSASQSHSVTESKWWTAMVTSRASRFPRDTPKAALWQAVTAHCVNTVAISPRVLAYMSRLACLRTSPGDFQQALSALRDLPSFSRVFKVNITPDNATHVSHVLASLLRDGLLTPGACAWLAEYSCQEGMAYTSFVQSLKKFPSRFSAIWKGRKSTLHRWRQSTIYAVDDAASHPSRVDPFILADSASPEISVSAAEPPHGSSVGASRHSPSYRGSLASEPYQVPAPRRDAHPVRTLGPPPVVEVPPRAPRPLPPIVELSPDRDVVDLTGDDIVDLTFDDIQADAPLSRSLGVHPQGTLDGSVAGPSDLTARGKKRRPGGMLTMKAERRARLQSIARARKNKQGQSPPPPYADPSQEY